MKRRFVCLFCFVSLFFGLFCGFYENWFTSEKNRLFSMFFWITEKNEYKTNNDEQYVAIERKFILSFLSDDINYFYSCCCCCLRRQERFCQNVNENNVIIDVCRRHRCRCRHCLPLSLLIEYSFWFFFNIKDWNLAMDVEISQNTVFVWYA